MAGEPCGSSSQPTVMAYAVPVPVATTSNIHSLIQDIHSSTDRSPTVMGDEWEKHDSALVEEYLNWTSMRSWGGTTSYGEVMFNNRASNAIG